MKIQHTMLLLLSIIMIGCSNPISSSSDFKIGLFLEDTIDDQGWNSKGYQGLLNIHANMNIDVVFKEEVNTRREIEEAVEAFEKEGVRLLFGHGRIYAEHFTELGKKYPNIHFVSFNGEVDGENVTSLHFNGYSMGFFAGLVAGAMTETGHISVVAAFPWQPEVEGFRDGGKVGNPSANSHIRFVESWTDENKAMEYFNELEEERVDIIYPTGDGYHIALIEAAKDNGSSIIGYVSDQSDLGESTVLTSTVQHVDELYELVAKQYIDRQLQAGNIRYDFQDGVISLGKFSPEVPEEIKKQIEKAMNDYIETGELPTKL